MKIVDAENVAQNLTAMKKSLGVDAISIDAMIDGLLNKEPAIDAEPVRHGHWIAVEEHSYVGENTINEWVDFYCSECDAPSSSPSPYCQYCGATMDEVEK